MGSRSAPSSRSLENEHYAVFSMQVGSINSSNGIVHYGATTVDGLSMDQLVNGAQAGAIIALLRDSSGFSRDLILSVPTNQVGGTQVTMADYIRFLATNGSLRLTAGVVQLGDFIKAAIFPTSLPVNTAELSSYRGGTTFANFSAGLSIIQNPTPYLYVDDVVVNSVD